MQAVSASSRGIINTTSTNSNSSEQRQEQQHYFERKPAQAEAVEHRLTMQWWRMHT